MSNFTAKPKRRKLPPVVNTVENRMVSKVDKLAKFEEFEEKILPALRGQIKKGATAQDLFKMYSAILAAKQITKALIGDDASAMAAITEILNRAEGKPTESVKVTHRYDSMNEQELDAYIESLSKDVTPTENK